MNNEMEVSSSANPAPPPFGIVLKNAREKLGLDKRDAASQLRLNEKIITMMEKDTYPSDLPATFIRGYLRTYAKFLQIPDHEILKGIEPIKPKANALNLPQVKLASSPYSASESSLMKFISYFILFIIISLAVLWWHNHPKASALKDSLSPPTEAKQARDNSTNLNQFIPKQTVSELPAAQEPAPVAQQFDENNTRGITTITERPTARPLPPKPTFSAKAAPTAVAPTAPSAKTPVQTQAASPKANAPAPVTQNTIKQDSVEPEEESSEHTTLSDASSSGRHYLSDLVDDLGTD